MAGWEIYVDVLIGQNNIATVPITFYNQCKLSKNIISKKRGNRLIRLLKRRTQHNDIVHSNWMKLALRISE